MAKEGIAVAQQIRPDLVIMDLSMPVMNGLQAAPKIREMFPKIPIILFTLFGDSRLELTAYKAGVTAVLAKIEPLSTLIQKAQDLMLI